MNDEIAPADFTWFLTLLVAIIPAVGGIVVAFVRREAFLPRPYRELGHVVSMLSKTPDGTKTREALDSLAVSMIEPLEVSRVGERRINIRNLVLTVLLGILSVGVMSGLVQWIVAAQGTPWIAIALGVTVVLGLGMVLAIAAAVSTVYRPSVSKRNHAG